MSNKTDSELEELLKLAGMGHKPTPYNLDGEESPLTYGSENVEEDAEDDVEEDMLKPKTEPELYDGDEMHEADLDDEDMEDEDEDENVEADFIEGDLVMIGYGSNEGKVGQVVEFSPSGLFATVKLKDDSVENHHVVDLFAVDEDFDEEEYYGIELDDEPYYDDEDDIEEGKGEYMNTNEGVMSHIDLEIRSGKEAGKSDAKIAAELVLDYDMDYNDALEMVANYELEECGVYEDEYVDENAFNAARDKAIASGASEFEFEGETYPVTDVDDDDMERAAGRFDEELSLEEDEHEEEMFELVIDNETAFYFLADNFTAEMGFSEEGNIMLPERMRGKVEQLMADAGYEDGEDYYFVDAVEEADLQNGYDDHHYVDAEDYFPTGNDGPAPKELGPSAARHGNNPLGTKMKVSEDNLSEGLKRAYRKFRTL